jgi:hypothetical protein
MKSLYKCISVSLLAMAGLTSCHNADNKFDDYEGGVTVYFPYQSPVRTLVMGEDTYNTDLDNAHKCKISATMGGAYSGRDIKVDCAIDESILNNLYFSSGEPIQVMPESYYTLSSTTIDFGGELTGSVELSLNDAFFEDDLAISGGYVIPLVMQSQTGADKINVGTYNTQTNSTAPQRTNSYAWEKTPKDFTLFCVKYISKFEGFFLRGITKYNGKDSLRAEGKTCIDDPIVNTKTLGLNRVSYTVPNKLYEFDEQSNLVARNVNHTIILTFDENQKCTLSAPKDASYIVNGSGEYKDHGAVKAWGGKDRDELMLSYTIIDGADVISVEETLILQRRGVKLETFDFIYKEGTK